MVQWVKAQLKEVQITKPTCQTFRTPEFDIRVVKPMSIFLVFLIAITLCSGSGLSYADDPSRVAATVNDVPITFAEVEEEINRVIARALYHRDVSPEKREAFRKEALERLIEKELGYQEAKRREIKAEKEKIREKVEEVKKRFPSEKAFEEALKRRSLTLKKYEELIEKEFIADKIFRAEVDDKAKTGDAELKAYYDGNMHRYREQEKIKVRHIMIMFDPSKGEEDKERARAKAMEALKRIKAGEDFATLAHEYSEDSYKAKGGDLGYIHRGRMEPDIEKAAFGLKTGETMGPAETEQGFYLIKVEDRIPERQLSFDEVKERIRSELEGRKKEETRKEWVNSLREKAKIEYR